MAIRLLAPPDHAPLESFLERHATTSMFPRSNIRAAGLQDHGKTYQASYLGAFRDGEIIGVVAHCWNGMVLLQVPELHDLLALRDAALALPTVAARGITGISGDYRQVRAFTDALDLDRSALQMNSRERLFVLDLADLVVPTPLAQGLVSCRRAAEQDATFLLDWRFGYDTEALGRAREDMKSDDEMADVRRQIELGHSFVLEDARSKEPLSRAAFNAALPDTVQVGGVYTPPSLRGKGYARAVVAGQLKIARAEGIRSAILFTQNAAAARAYEAIGFHQIGEFGIVLLKKPWFPEVRR